MEVILMLPEYLRSLPLLILQQHRKQQRRIPIQRRELIATPMLPVIFLILISRLQEEFKSFYNYRIREFRRILRGVPVFCAEHLSKPNRKRGLRLVRTSPEHLRNASRRRSMRLVRETNHCDNNQIIKLTLQNNCLN